MPNTASPETARVKQFSAATGLKGLGGFYGLGLGLSGLYAATGFGMPCPFRMATGWDCPLCGGTRFGSALLHLDLLAAFVYNPVVFIGLLIVGVLTVAWTVEVLGGPKLRLPKAIAARISAIGATRWLVIGLIAAVIFTLLRNLL